MLISPDGEVIVRLQVEMEPLLVPLGREWEPYGNARALVLDYIVGKELTDGPVHEFLDYHAHRRIPISTQVDPDILTLYSGEFTVRFNINHNWQYPPQ